MTPAAKFSPDQRILGPSAPSRAAGSGGVAIRRAFWGLLWIGWLNVSAATPAFAQSIYSNAHPKFSNLYADVRGQQVGDLIVVTIDQSTEVQNRDQRQLNKLGSAETSGSGGFGFSGILGTASGGLENESESEARRRFNGDTRFSSERDILDRFAVTVVDRLPNGNLLIAGQRRVNLDGDIRTLVLTGTIRAIDVSAGNTISSRLVSQMEIHYESDGTETKFLNQGWLGRKFNRLWPF